MHFDEKSMFAGHKMEAKTLKVKANIIKTAAVSFLVLIMLHSFQASNDMSCSYPDG